MKEINYRGLDSEIHQRVYGETSSEACPAYSREAELARKAVELINASGLFRVNLCQVVGPGHKAEDWQCEVFTADGLDNLATEYDHTEALAICRTIIGAGVNLAGRSS